LQDLFREDICGDGRKRGNSSLEVVAAVVLRSVHINNTGLEQLYSLPVALHVCLLEIDIAVGNLAGVACVWV
jgi:hypothetical protein